MNAPRRYHDFTHKDARYRIASSHPELIMEEIKRLRHELEIYVAVDHAFRDSLVPVPAAAHAPPLARHMAEAALAAGVGPLAAVAGALAEAAARCALDRGADEAIVDNGGDIFMHSPRPVTVGLFTTGHSLSGRLAFLVRPEEMPLALCASSGVMGHSFSLGKCDLAVAVSPHAALADAAATLAANLVSAAADVEPALKRVQAIPGLSGVLIIMGDAVGMAGNLPELVTHTDADVQKKIPAHTSWRGMISW